MLVHSFDLKAPHGSKAANVGVSPALPALGLSALLLPRLLGKALATSWKDMVTLARSQRTIILHYISNFICFGVLFLLFKCKNKINLLHML